MIAGDLTDYGLPEEAKALVKDLTGAVRIPIIAVLGNHDFESGAEQEIRQILSGAGVCVLDGDSCVVGEVGFAGCKGFAGGFGRNALGPWGEQITKLFVRARFRNTPRVSRGTPHSGSTSRSGGDSATIASSTCVTLFSNQLR